VRPFDVRERTNADAVRVLARPEIAVFPLRDLRLRGVSWNPTRAPADRIPGAQVRPPQAARTQAERPEPAAPPGVQAEVHPVPRVAVVLTLLRPT
jgi:hypothetical protein